MHLRHLADVLPSSRLNLHFCTTSNQLSPIYGTHLQHSAIATVVHLTCRFNSTPAHKMYTRDRESEIVKFHIYLIHYINMKYKMILFFLADLIIR